MSNIVSASIDVSYLFVKVSVDYFIVAKQSYDDIR